MLPELTQAWGKGSHVGGGRKLRALCNACTGPTPGAVSTGSGDALVLFDSDPAPIKMNAMVFANAGESPPGEADASV